jgi:hypothetical protein
VCVWGLMMWECGVLRADGELTQQEGRRDHMRVFHKYVQHRVPAQWASNHIHAIAAATTYMSMQQQGQVR